MTTPAPPFDSETRWEERSVTTPAPLSAPACPTPLSTVATRPPSNNRHTSEATAGGGGGCAASLLPVVQVDGGAVEVVVVDAAHPWSLHWGSQQLGFNARRLKRLPALGRTCPEGTAGGDSIDDPVAGRGSLTGASGVGARLGQVVVQVVVDEVEVAVVNADDEASSMASQATC